MNDLKVSSQFRTDSLPGLVIIWEFGSSKLHLMRSGGRQGTFKIDTKTSATYRDGAGALKGAIRWFALLEKVYRSAPAGSHEVYSEDV